jgi:hypothetical protein
MLSAIIARTKVENWARKPGWRIAAKDRFEDSDALTGTGLISFMKNHQIAVHVKGRIGQRDARQGKRHENMPKLPDSAAWADGATRGAFADVARTGVGPVDRRHLRGRIFRRQAQLCRQGYGALYVISGVAPTCPNC